MVLPSQSLPGAFPPAVPCTAVRGVIYLLQIFEVPYLVQIGDPDALLYVNAFSLLFFSIQMLIMCECYFFPERKDDYRRHWIFLPVVVVLVPLFLQAVGLVHMPEGWRSWAIGTASVTFLFYLWCNIRMALRIERAVRRANEERYADSDDFPVRFANLIKWVPTLIIILLAINFYADNPWVKFIRDVLFTGASIWFCILTLNPWRKMIDTPTEEEESGDSNLLPDIRYDELTNGLEQLLTKEKIFTEPHITVDTLMVRLGTNAKYLTEVIHRNGYQSFYDMICQHRVRYAIGLIHLYPDERLADIAERCGFSSQASMAKAFKSQGKEAPSRYR